MKKALKALTALGGAALAVFGGIMAYRKFFAKDEDLEEDFDDEELFDDDDSDDIAAFEEEDEIFEEDEPVPSADPASETETIPEDPDPEKTGSGEKGVSEDSDAARTASEETPEKDS